MLACAVLANSLRACYILSWQHYAMGHALTRRVLVRPYSSDENYSTAENSRAHCHARPAT
jgi:hypothetical protein